MKYQKRYFESKEIEIDVWSPLGRSCRLISKQRFSTFDANRITRAIISHLR